MRSGFRSFLVVLSILSASLEIISTSNQINLSLFCVIQVRRVFLSWSTVGELTWKPITASYLVVYGSLVCDYVSKVCYPEL